MQKKYRIRIFDGNKKLVQLVTEKADATAAEQYARRICRSVNGTRYTVVKAT